MATTFAFDCNLPLSFPLPSSHSSFPPLSRSLPFRSRPPKCSYGVRGSAVSSPSGSGAKPSRQTFWCILESKSAALVAAVFLVVPMKTCNFLHKTKLDIVRRVQFLTGRRPMRSFSPGSVASIALWKSAPTLALF